jgi:hypothetical protein
VVGLDLADGGQHRPGQPRAAVGRRLVDGQQLGRDVLLGVGAGRPAPDQGGGEPQGHEAQDQEDDGEDAEQELDHHLADRWYFRIVESVDRIGRRCCLGPRDGEDRRRSDSRWSTALVSLHISVICW